MSHKETIDYWAPDEPPITTIFSELGSRIIQDLYTSDAEVNRRIFRMIEDAMASGDDELRTAVGTGLIEAVIARTDGNEQLWRDVESMFGDRSLEYAQAWRSWGS